MTKRTQTILLASIGVVAMLLIVVVVVGIWAFRSMVDNSDMDEASASRVMEEVRARFQHVPPVLDLKPGSLTLSRRPPDAKPPGELKTLHILRWNTEDERLSRIEVPFWLLRMRDSPIDVMYEGDPGENGLRTRTASSVRVSDIERYGPALLVDDDLPDGGHLIVWSD